MDEILSIDKWGHNGHLVADCAKLYLQQDWKILDPTYGYGVFWLQWKPINLTACDLNPSKSPIGYPVDFRSMPFGDRFYDAVVFDPPYKLNGTPSESDERYGIETPTRWQDRLELIMQGVAECCRVCDNILLVKCQDQVCSGKIVWQTDDIMKKAEHRGFKKIDRFDFLSYRPQPSGTRQVHARRNSSQLLVFKRD